MGTLLMLIPLLQQAAASNHSTKRQLSYVEAYNRASNKYVVTIPDP